MKIVIRALGNAGYGKDQVRGLKVRDIKNFLEQLDDEDEIVTYNSSNRYGASYGELYLDIIEDEEEDY